MIKSGMWLLKHLEVFLFYKGKCQGVAVDCPERKIEMDC